jgi:hypothetical protein
MSSTWTDYSNITSNLTRSLKTTSAEPDVKRESAYYLANIGKVKTIDDFLKNSRLYNYAMKAYGLSDMIYAKAFMRKVLAGGTTDSRSFANSLTDPRFAAFAKAYNFATHGENATIFDSAQKVAVDKYVRQQLETDAGKQNQGVQLALYFQGKASAINNAYDILADRALITVVQTALGISPSTSSIDIKKQAAMLDAKLNYADFKDPAKLNKFLQRYSANYDINNPPTSQTTSPTLALITGANTSAPIFSNDLLASIQSLKR